MSHLRGEQACISGSRNSTCLEGPAAAVAASATVSRALGPRFACCVGDLFVNRLGVRHVAALQRVCVCVCVLISSCCWWSGAGSCSPGAKVGCCVHTWGSWASRDGLAGWPVTWGAVGGTIQVTDPMWQWLGGPCCRVSPVFHRGVCSVRWGWRPSHVAVRVLCGTRGLRTSPSGVPAPAVSVGS